MAQPYVGEIRMFAGSFAPAGWAFCDGQSLAIAEHETLFKLIGTIYGGNAETTFNLPDLRGRLSVHQGAGTSGSTFVLGETGGAEDVTLTVNQMPVHGHALTVADHVGDQVSPGGALPAQSFNVTPYINEAANAGFAPPAIVPTGGSQPHTNFQPYLCVNHIISLFGIFPSAT